MFRVTQQSCEVLGRGSGVLRITQQSIDVLLSARVHVVGASDTVVLVDRATGPVGGSETLTLADAGVGIRIRHYFRSDRDMFTMEAPYPAIQTTSLLPNPEFSDSEALLHSITRKLAIDGTRYTYVKRRTRRKLLWTFHVTRNKALEIKAFIQCYYATRIRMTDHNGRQWVGHFTSNPFEQDTSNRSGPAISPLPLGETVRVDIEFEGVENA